MLKVVLCDDNPSVLEYYQGILKKTAEQHEIDMRLTTCESGEQLLFHFSDNPNSVDLIYLDIVMDKVNGVEVAKKLREIGCVAEIIFLSAREEFVFDSFDVNPFYYIVKESMPLHKFKDIFLRAAEQVQKKNDDYICINSGATFIKLPISQIFYFEIKNRIVTVHYNTSTFEFYSKLEELKEELVDKGFVRTHRSFLANCYHIQKLERNEALLTDGTKIPVSGKNYGEVKKAFSEYWLHL